MGTWMFIWLESIRNIMMITIYFPGLLITVLLSEDCPRISRWAKSNTLLSMPWEIKVWLIVRSKRFTLFITWNSTMLFMPIKEPSSRRLHSLREKERMFSKIYKHFLMVLNQFQREQDYTESNRIFLRE